MLQLESILALEFSKLFPNNKIRYLVENYNSLNEIIDTIPEQKVLELNKNRISISNIIDQSFQLAQNHIENARKYGARILTLWDRDYPTLLKEIHYPPVVIFVLGQLKAPDSISISIVGTRKCTTYGKLVTEQFVQTFVRHNLIITSGLAYGIDTTAHLSALKSNGTTYAIIASGLDRISPLQAQKVADEILRNGGAIISEHRFGTPARNIFFPQRNRIISGISLATIVIESDIKGGAMITARFAFDQNRDVFAVPGNVTSIKSRGTNNLIKINQAKIATDPEEVLYELGILSERINFGVDIQNEPADPIDKKIYSSLTLEPKHIDTIAIEQGISIQELLVRLLNLEFSGFIKQLPGKFFIRYK